MDECSSVAFEYLEVVLTNWCLGQHKDRFKKDIRKIITEAKDTLESFYHSHPRLMITIHTCLATRHVFHGLGHLISDYASAGLLSADFKRQSKEQLFKQEKTIEAFFDANPFRRLQFTLAERFNIIVMNRKANDMHPMVDKDFYKDERKSTTEQLSAVNHSVTRALGAFPLSAWLPLQSRWVRLRAHN